MVLDGGWFKSSSWEKKILPIQENEHEKEYSEGGSFLGFYRGVLNADVQVGFDASLEGKMLDAMSCLLCICRESQLA